MASETVFDPSKVSSVVAEGSEMRRIDLEVSDILSIVRVQEVASTRLADLITYHLRKTVSQDAPILFVVGKGNNGANGIAAARHLVGRGRKNVTVLLGFSREDMAEMPKEQLKFYEHFGGTTLSFASDGFPSVPSGGIIVDGLLGTGISKPPRGVIKDLIELINDTERPVLALDVPSGLNHVTGEVLEPCIRAAWTYNFHLLKSGQVVDGARKVIGELWTADTDLTYTAWEEAGVKTESIQELYSTGPIRQVF